MSGSSRIARNTGVLVAGDIVAKVASLAFYVALARYLGQGTFGDFNFALSLAVVLVTIAGFGLDTLVTREIARDPDQFHPMLWNAIVAKSGFGVLAVGVATAIAIVGNYGTEVTLTVTIISVATLLELIGKSAGAALQGLEDMAPLAISSIVQRFSTALLTIVALQLGAGLLDVALLYLLGSVMGLAYWVMAMHRRGKRPREMGLSAFRMRSIVATSVPIGLGVIFGTILYRFDSTILSFLKDNDAVGLYGAAYRLLDSTLFISFFFVGAIYPLLSRLGGSNESGSAEVFELGCKMLTIVLLPIGAAFVLFAAPMVDLIYGTGFGDSASAVRWLGSASLLYGIGYLAGSVLITHDRQKALAWIVAAVAAQNVVLNLVLVPSLSFDGAAAATTISQGTLALASTYFAIRTTGRLSVRRIASGSVVGLVAMVAVSLAVGLTIPTMILALAVYGVVVVIAERRLYPDDIHRGVQSVLGDSDRGRMVLTALGMAERS